MTNLVLALEFGRLVRHLRQQRGLIQQQVATKTGFSRVAISNIEAGRQGICLEHVFKFAEALGVEPEDLLPGKREKRHNIPVDDLVAQVRSLKASVRMRDKVIKAQAEVIARIERNVEKWRK